MRLAASAKDALRKHWYILVVVIVVVTLATAGKTVGLAFDRSWITIDEKRTTTVALPNGGSLTIPPGAMRHGSRVKASAKGTRPDGTREGIQLVGQSVELVADPPDAIQNKMQLRMPVPADTAPAGIDPAVWFGISTYDPHTSSWEPLTAEYDNGTVVASIDHLSWWNPFSWDFRSFFDSITQGYGEFVGKRASAPECEGPGPDWVDTVVGISDADNVAIRACAQTHEDALHIELVNNRSYGQMVRFDPAVTKMVHDTPNNAVSFVMSKLIDFTMDAGEVYLPPLTRASVSISGLTPGRPAVYHIGPTVLTVGADFAFYLLEPLRIMERLVGPLTKYPDLFKECVLPNGKRSLTDRDSGTLWSHALLVFQCVVDGLRKNSDRVNVPKSKLSQLLAQSEMLKRAVPVASGVLLAHDLVWKLGDLVADWFADRSAALGNGFQVSAKVVTPPPPPPPPVEKQKRNCWKPWNWFGCIFN